VPGPGPPDQGACSDLYVRQDLITLVSLETRHVSRRESEDVGFHLDMRQSRCRVLLGKEAFTSFQNVGCCLAEERLPDAGVPVDVLAELLDHRSYSMKPPLLQPSGIASNGRGPHATQGRSVWRADTVPPLPHPLSGRPVENAPI